CPTSGSCGSRWATVRRTTSSGRRRWGLSGAWTGRPSCSCSDGPPMREPETSDDYTDPRLAVLYDRMNPWGPGDNFYLDLVLGAGSVLDVGCGTGALLRRARASGH